MLKWNVFIENPNTRRIEIYNIFEYGSLEDTLKKIKKECNGDKKKFLIELDHELRYRYWSKCEWEIILSGWPPNKKFKDEKVDVYSQLTLNWDIFVNYIWENL